MNIIKVNAEGMVFCKSTFYSTVDIVSGDYIFSSGINEFQTEIDGGIWGTTYLLSMYDHFDSNEKECLKIKSILVDGESISVSDICKKACYIDDKYPLFNSKKSIYSLVKKHLQQSKIPYTTEEILDMFGIETPYHDRCIATLGNTKYQAMSAIAFAAGKEIFCFPWLSKNRFAHYKKRICFVVNVLAELGKIAILPHS